MIVVVIVFNVVVFVLLFCLGQTLPGGLPPWTGSHCCCGLVVVVVVFNVVVFVVVVVLMFLFLFFCFVLAKLYRVACLPGQVHIVDVLWFGCCCCCCCFVVVVIVVFVVFGCCCFCRLWLLS